MSEFETYTDKRGRTRRRRKALRVPGHKLEMRWSGEYGVESSSTGECSCGWQESASSQHEVRFEYRQHLRSVLKRQEREKLARLNEEIKAQWAKYEAARGSVPYVALLQIDAKLTRLMHERDALAASL